MAVYHRVYSINERKVHHPSRLAPEIQGNGHAFLSGSSTTFGWHRLRSSLGSLPPIFSGNAYHYLRPYPNNHLPYHQVRGSTLLFWSACSDRILVARETPQRVRASLGTYRGGVATNDIGTDFVNMDDCPPFMLV